jgi:predicted nucleic acid-binding protein
VEHLLAEIDAIPVTSRVARTHAEIWTALAQRGDVIGTMTSGSLYGAGPRVLRGNGERRRFSRVPGLRVVGSGG